MNRWLSVIGIFLTISYLASIGYWFGYRLGEIFAMKPNETGDFLAGIFGPVAIFWLILGFFQQGIELRKNTEVLKLQAEELKSSVEQQKNLVEVSRQQVESEIEVIRFERARQAAAARPKFVFQSVHCSFHANLGSY